MAQRTLNRLARWLLALPLSLVVLAVLWLFFNEPAPDPEAAPAVSGTTTDLEPEHATDTLEARVNDGGVERVAEDRGSATGCYTLEQIWLHPSIAAELAYFGEFNVHGWGLMNHASLSRSALEPLAHQGDSAAMAMLAAGDIMTAHGLPADRASEFFMIYPMEGTPAAKAPDVRGVTSPAAKNFSPLEEAAAQSAASWLWEAALHGRYAALSEYGIVRMQLGDTAVSNGWVSETDYEQLPRKEQNALNPAMVYSRAGSLLVPDDARQGIVISLVTSFQQASGTDRQLEIAQRIVESIRQEQRRRGIVVQSPDASQFMRHEDMIDSLCPGETERDEFDGWELSD